MADLEISIPYKAITKETLVTFCIFWAVLGVAALYFLHQPILWLDTVFHGGWYVFIKVMTFLVASVLYTYVPFNLQQRYLRGNHIFANSDGLGVPPALIGASLWMPWSELRTADIIHCGYWDSLKLSFNSRRTVFLHTNRMNPTDLEQLLMAIEAWAVKCISSEALTNYRDTLENKKVGVETSTGYTRLWEEELQRRFNCTTFVPLEPGAKLRSGDITILRQIAFGGFSAVYLAEDPAKQQIVIKE
jgi:hypothetical protein